MLKKLSISQKLYLGFAVIVALIFVLVLSAYRGFVKVEATLAANTKTGKLVGG